VLHDRRAILWGMGREGPSMISYATVATQSKITRRGG
jgi:hypothetical protein